VKSGGYMTEIDPFLLTLSNAYSAQVQRLIHGDQQLGAPRRAGELTRVIFDSGSTYTYFPHQAYIELIAAVSTNSCVD
jgi:hypothetical protein